ncbi:MAG TPA: ribulose-phosphate 3-epimerase [Halanaerobiales bacterium]|nr:ribulose-phosphate 3-epimerase [Halanaerobiales bacterium]
MVNFAPSILASDFSKLKKEVESVKDAKYLHLDIMDGRFVPNITYGPLVVKAIRPYSDNIFDTHLMIVEPEKYIKDFAEAGSDIITVHVEATDHVHRAIQMIKNEGCQAGVTLNPATPLSTIENIIDDVDLVLIMSVNPGFGGQKFIPQMLDKVKRLGKMIDKSNTETLIEIDGGINFDNVKEVVEAGVDIIVSGSTIFKGNPAQNLKKFRRILKG